MEGTSENYIPQDKQVENVQEQNIASDSEQVQELSEEDAKLQELLEIAVKDGVDKAVAVAKDLGNPRIQELFHDTLVNNPEWLAQLEASGKFEKI